MLNSIRSLGHASRTSIGHKTRVARARAVFIGYDCLSWGLACVDSVAKMTDMQPAEDVLKCEYFLGPRVKIFESLTQVTFELLECHNGKNVSRHSMEHCDDLPCTERPSRSAHLCAV